MNTVRVNTSTAQYDVLIGSGLLGTLGTLAREALTRPAARAFLACDSGVPARFVSRAVDSLAAAGFLVTTAVADARETHKSIEALRDLLVQLAESRHERFEPVLALGGGIVGDVAGFAAAAYRRGVPVIQCPTTLLSMVDASVGGKTGINLALPAATPGRPPSIKKNLVGAFHQPARVVADVSVLESLPDRQLRAGVAECIKHGMISAGLIGAFSDAALFDWLVSQMPSLLARNAATLAEAVRRNVAVKAAVVAGDEREEAPSAAGGRALLNLGHTFAHAIETLDDLRPDDRTAPPLHHGEAVAVGLVAAARCSLAAGLCSTHLVSKVEDAVSAAGLPIRLAGLPDADRLLELMSHDKKVVGGVLRLVLPVGDGPGACRVVDNLPVDHIAAAWDAVRAQA